MVVLSLVIDTGSQSAKAKEHLFSQNSNLSVHLTVHLTLVQTQPSCLIFGYWLLQHHLMLASCLFIHFCSFCSGATSSSILLCTISLINWVSNFGVHEIHLKSLSLLNSRLLDPTPAIWTRTPGAVVVYLLPCYCTSFFIQSVKKSYWFQFLYSSCLDHCLPGLSNSSLKYLLMPRKMAIKILAYILFL